MVVQGLKTFYAPAERLDMDSIKKEELISSMNEKIVKDDLTGIYNRRYLTERLPIVNCKWTVEIIKIA